MTKNWRYRIADLRNTRCGRLHTAVQSHPHPEEWLERQRASLGAEGARDVIATPWGRFLLERTAARAAYWARRSEDLVRAMEAPGHEKLSKGYGGSLAETAEGLRRVESAAGVGWEAVRAALPVPFPKVYFRGDAWLMPFMMRPGMEPM